MLQSIVNAHPDDPQMFKSAEVASRNSDKVSVTRKFSKADKPAR